MSDELGGIGEQDEEEEGEFGERGHGRCGILNLAVSSYTLMYSSIRESFWK